jgi:DNA-binding NarL/FixJ family response regulator
MSQFQITRATAAFFVPSTSEAIATPMSQQEVARELGISQPTVVRLEQSALRKLRALPEAEILLQFIRCRQRF